MERRSKGRRFFFAMDHRGGVVKGLLGLTPQASHCLMNAAVVAPCQRIERASRVIRPQRPPKTTIAPPRAAAH